MLGPVRVYCGRGKRLLAAVDELERHGYQTKFEIMPTDKWIYIGGPGFADKDYVTIGSGDMLEKLYKQISYDDLMEELNYGEQFNGDDFLAMLGGDVSV